MRNLTTLFFILLLVGQAVAQSSVPWESAEGILRFNESRYKRDFFPLVNHFQAQPNRIVCGPTSGSIILNALRLRKSEDLPKVEIEESDRRNIPKDWKPNVFKYTVDNFFTPEVEKVKSRSRVYGMEIDGETDAGYQLAQYGRALEAHGLAVDVTVVDENTDLDVVRRQFKENLVNTDDFILVNFYLRSLGQDAGGHISPIGAYHEPTDSVLLMDVNPTRSGFIWVELKSLVTSMATLDTVSNRGYLLVRDSK